MKLSDGEKLIAFLLADIIEAQGIKGEMDPAFIKTAITGDDLWALKWKYSALFHDEGPSDEIVDETAKLMTMCRVIENSIAALSPEERALIPKHRQKVFGGFDGNEEPHHGVAMVLVEQLDRFSEWKDRPLNSHHNTLAHYRGMREIYEGLKRNQRGLLDFASIELVIGRK